MTLMELIWKCPKCGYPSRLGHRYRSGLAPWTEAELAAFMKGAELDPGPCQGQLLLFPNY